MADQPSDRAEKAILDAAEAYRLVAEAREQRARAEKAEAQLADQAARAAGAMVLCGEYLEGLVITAYHVEPDICWCPEYPERGQSHHTVCAELRKITDRPPDERAAEVGAAVSGLVKALDGLLSEACERTAPPSVDAFYRAEESLAAYREALAGGPGDGGGEG